ncbi:ATP-dependent Clp protease adaptor ClpS, partial [Salinimicrobium oceani]
MSTKEEVLEKKEVKSKESKLHEIVLYNDDYNTFDHVIET